MPVLRHDLHAHSHNQKFCSYQCRWDKRAKLKEPKRKSASEAGWVVGYEEKTANGKIQKEQEQTEAQPDGREEQRNKLEQMASLENRSVSNLVEVMADERWERLAEQQGIAYAKTIAEAMNLKLEEDNPADREKLRRAILGLVAERKMPK